MHWWICYEIRAKTQDLTEFAIYRLEAGQHHAYRV